MLDKQLVEQQLRDLAETVAALRPFSGITAVELQGSREKSWFVQRGLHIATQLVLDIGSHLLAANGANIAEEYAVIFDRLAERGILPDLFARKIRPMAGFRNVLVHGYAKVDPKKVSQILQQDLPDFEAFAQHVSRYLKHGSD